MPLVATKYFGTLPYETADLLNFPHGLPAFEQENRFVLMQVPGKAPLILLQSATHQDVCFPALPVLDLEPEYQLAVSFEDLSALKLETHRQPEIGGQILVLVLLAVENGQLTSANLMAPVVINIAESIGVQAIRCDFRYSHQHPVFSPVETTSC